ncbi:uncharacterized protein LOC132609600 isoform X2 [Lycium barbarum]|uniref:uncharacterized protein LOC132609600 isoform X2 n=1 Tax=Lycium barbarum TaxID=112863 RepID=UPI00293ED8CD|nr:uncharacterized protein LOC132609600 isoform X2 [Lycium barbarum]
MLRAAMSTILLPLQSSHSLKHLFFRKPLIQFFSQPRKITTTSRLFSLKPLAVSSPIRNYVDEKIDPTYLSCSMPHKNPLKVAVLVSGGVDSSVALRLLHAAGHSCTAFYLKIWFQDDFENFWSECPWEDDLKYAKAVCDQVDVPLEVVHLTDEYWNNVVSYIIEEYKCGRTPNPDVLCNTRIKFGAFMDAISGMEFDFVASGHYAKIVHTSTEQLDEPSVLELSKDMVKDQTYFLSHLSQAQLKRLVFPLGCIQKDEVRMLAKSFNLPNQDRKDSQGICFLGKTILYQDASAKCQCCILGVKWVLPRSTLELLCNWKGIGRRKAKEDWWQSIPACIWWSIWKERNSRQFEDKANSIQIVKMKCLSFIYFWCKQDIVGEVGDLVDFLGNV